MPSLLSLSFATLLATGMYAMPHAKPKCPPKYPWYPVKGTGYWEDAVIEAKRLVAELDLHEKVTLVTGKGWEQGPCVGNIDAVPKINFPGFCLQDSPAGVRFADKVSVFGASINAAATFDKRIMEERGIFLGEEFRNKGIHIALGPAMNMARTPEGGRNWEGQGADPYLAANSAALQVYGIQSQGVIATAKHWLANEQEHARDRGSSDVSDRVLHEIYMPAFEASIQAGAGAIMCAYNQVNGTYACENPHLLQELLKNELDFQGFVMTDWWAAMSARETLFAGSDMMMPGGKTMAGGLESYWGPNLVKMVESKEVPMERLDDMVTRILATWVQSGQNYTDNFPATNIDSWKPENDKHVDVRSHHHEHIREMGAASTVLLKNLKNVLPLKDGLKKIAIIGSDAQTPADPNEFPDRGGVNGHVALGWGSGVANYPYLIGPYDGIKPQAEKRGIEIAHSFDDWNLDTAAKTAKGADVALVFAAANSGEAFITVDGNVGDRKNLTLWNNGDNLIKSVADANPNTVVVIHGPGAVLMPWIDHPNIKSVIWAGMPGQESGNALADVLFGDVNPSGRLPFSIMKKYEDYSAHVQYDTNVAVDPLTNRCLPESCPHVVYEEGLLVDYRHSEAKGIAPLFGFGHGLSYTSFQYSNVTIQTARPGQAGVQARITVMLTNTGAVDGDEVLQLYISTPPEAGKPFKELKGFERKYLLSKTSAKVQFDLDERDLSYWSPITKKWTLPTGEFGVHIGASHNDIRVKAKFVRQ
ncbi:glycoside hydrolase superfamily [Phlyctochytrium arcticum]|nr:glycoside hydrolase superfamily [Phlyctochytrium arcticum]